MKARRPFFRRHLPHYYPGRATYFITFRLADSLPTEAIDKLRAVGQDGILSYKYDEYLDRANHGPAWLARAEIAKLVADALHYWDGKRYRLLCYCIMSNHVHLVIDVGQVDNLSYTLSQILHSIKRHTAREANKLLHRSGAFWEHESYDHVVRAGTELIRIVSYVLNNPVMAGLVKTSEEWKWNYLNREVCGDGL